MNGVLERLVKYKIFVVEGPGNGAAVAGAGAENASNLLTINIFTLGDLTQNIPKFLNLILNLSLYTNADPKSTYMSTIQQNSVEL